MNDSDEKETLDWLAFQYISNELPEDELGRFELRLADDQAAREAVARAIELTSTIAAVYALDDFRVHKPAKWWKRVAWISTVTAASLAVILLRGAFDSSPNGDDGSTAHGQSQVSGELASAWVGTFDEFESAADEDMDEQDEDLLVSEDDVVEAEAPDWMLVAVSAMHKKNGDEE